MRSRKGWEPVTLQKEDRVGRLESPWEYVLENPAVFSSEIFAQVAVELVLHPERNSKNIRRADILFDTDDDTDKERNGMVCVRTIRLRLMPRNPNLDPELEQTCRFYVAEGDTLPTLITYNCHYVEGIGVPYYFPNVLGV